MAIANNFKGPFDPEFCALSSEQIQVLVIAYGDKNWAKEVSEYKNISDQIQAHYDSIKKSDFKPKDDEEKSLFGLYFAWLNAKRDLIPESKPGTVRIISVGDDDEDEEG